MSYGELLVSADAEALAHDAARMIADAARAKQGVVRIALSGGSTPRRTYQVLADSPLRESFPWQRVHWFWGDERFVPPDHEESNFRMVREAMLDRVPVPAVNVFAVPTVGLSPEAAAVEYEAVLKRAYGAEALQPGRPLLDVCLLGLGDDGHTASLIPGEPVLEERTRWVGVVGHGRPEVRITVTYPVIDNSALIAFLVAGAAKRAILAQVRAGASTVPAARLHPAGRLAFLADRAAAGDGA